jgi:hypothetical protein
MEVTGDGMKFTKTFQYGQKTNLSDLNRLPFEQKPKVCHCFNLFAYTFTLWDKEMVPCVGNAEQGRRPQLMSCVSVKTWRHTDTLIWVPSFWTLRISEN